MTDKEYQLISQMPISKDDLVNSASPVYRVLNTAKMIPELFRHRALAMDEVIQKSIAVIQSGEPLTFGQWSEEYLTQLEALSVVETDLENIGSTLIC